MLCQSKESKAEPAPWPSVHAVLQGGSHLITGWSTEGILKTRNNTKTQRCKKVYA